MCSCVQGDQSANTVARDICVDEEIHLHALVSAESNDARAPTSLVLQVCVCVWVSVCLYLSMCLYLSVIV